ncbi:hypothetical protein ACFLQU_06175 [Verrucomicrobiota bacterium]
MKKDLLGHPLKAKPPYLAPTLQRFDKRTFQERLERLQHLQTVFPKGYGFLLPPESAFVLSEVKMCFINGQFIATLMLTQAFIEHALQASLEGLGHPRVARRGLSEITKWFRSNRPQHDFLMEKIDKLRRFRNPFSHLRPFDDPDTIGQRMFKSKQLPEDIIEKEARDALALMYQVAITRFQ